MTAVQGKNTQCVTALLDLGARLDLQDHYGDTVYHHAVIHYPEVISVSGHIQSQWNLNSKLHWIGTPE